MAQTAKLMRRCQFMIRRDHRRVSTSCSRRTSTSPQRRQAAAVPVLGETQAAPKPFTDIPGPLALPMLRHSAHVLPRIGNFHHVVGLGLLEGLRNRYGDLVRLAKGSRRRPVLYIFDPELMREVYESGLTVKPRWERSPLETQRLGHKSQCPHHTEETKNIWTALRVLLQDSNFLSNYDRAFDDIATDVTRRLGALRHAENALNEELETEIYRWAIESLGVVILGRRLGCLDGLPHVPTPENRQPERTSLDDDSPEKCSLTKRSFVECTPAENLVRCSREIANCGYLVRSEGTLKTESKTFGDALQAFDQHFGLVKNFLITSFEELDSGNERPEMMLLKNLRPLNADLLPLTADALLAGVDPLTHSAIALFYQASLHAARQQRAHDELAWRAAAEDAGARRPAELPYIAACAKEALRLHPATGGVVRRTTESMLLAGYEIPNGVDIVLAHGVSSKSEQQWSRARTFLPERWYSQGWEPMPASRAHPIATLPFGVTCPASAITGKMLGALAARVLEKFRLEWHGPSPSLVTAGVNRLQPPYYLVLQDAS